MHPAQYLENSKGESSSHSLKKVKIKKEKKEVEIIVSSRNIY